MIKEGEQNPEYNKHLRLEAPLGLTIHTCSAFRLVPNQVGYTARIAIYKKRDIGLLSFPQGQPKKKTTEKKPGLIYKRHPGSLFNQSAKMVKPWTDHRREITRLYITERMTLANVQKAMKERYNFQASCVSLLFSLPSPLLPSSVPLFFCSRDPLVPHLSLGCMNNAAYTMILHFPLFAVYVHTASTLTSGTCKSTIARRGRTGASGNTS